MTEFQGVADTLYIPLEARIYVSKKFPDYFYDAKALELEEHIPNRAVRKKSVQYAFVASVARYFVLDNWVRDFHARHERCNIVNLGVGLETFAHRLELPGANLYGIDLPHVIELRRDMLSEGSTEVMIASDILDLAWMDQIDHSLPTLFIAAGVFQYFTHDKVVSLLKALGDAFTESEIIFDATTKRGLKVANRYVRMTGNKSAQMEFYVDDAAELAEECNATLMEVRPFFTETRRLLGKRVKPYVRLITAFADRRRNAFEIHLKLS
ncbi:MAG: conjugal transfer protein [Arachnia propionica]|nr:MAG: conjugal transfer protein [Arachnia propionica]